MASSLTGKNNTNSYVGKQSKVKTIDYINELDRVNIYEFENGMDVELTELGGELNSENIRKAQSKVLSNLKKDPAFYTNKIAAETIARFGEYGSGKKKKEKYTNAKEAESVKADVKVKEIKAETNKDNEMKEISKVEKANVSKDKKPTMASKPKEMTQTPKKAKGIKSTLEVPGKEKKINLKENKEYQGISDEQKAKLEKTIEYLKQQGKNEMAAALERLIKSGIKDLDETNAKTKSYSNEEDMDKRDVKSSLQRQVSQPIKSWDTIVKGLSKDGKIKLTKENVSMIKEMVSEAVAGYVAVKPGDTNTAQNLTKKGFNVKFDDPKNPND